MPAERTTVVLPQPRLDAEGVEAVAAGVDCGASLSIAVFIKANGAAAVARTLLGGAGVVNHSLELIV